MYGVVSALLSAVAAVYTEWVLKKNNDTLYWQNMLLYGFGACFNFANLVHRCVGDCWVGVCLLCRTGSQIGMRVCTQPGGSSRPLLNRYCPVASATACVAPRLLQQFCLWRRCTAPGLHLRHLASGGKPGILVWRWWCSG